jgi:hypothetical protein
MKTRQPLAVAGSDSNAAPAPQGAAYFTYQALLANDEQSLPLARNFLERQLQRAAGLNCDLPENPAHLLEWVVQGARATSGAYKRYLESRERGQPRRYFSNRAHALYFLQAMAPTKLIDGAWLYGLLPQWREQRFHGLIHSYLEELGGGDPAHHHALLYRKLLTEQGCAQPAWLSDQHFIQAAQQLALGRLAAAYLPEVIGYNLGYEQLPLHLLISGYELSELDIDPYYFHLHLSIDNASSGHGHIAAQAVLDNLPVVDDAEAFYRRVALGYRLTQLGLGATAVIAAFDLKRELLAMLERKREVASAMHSDFCYIGGRTINQWLSQPGQLDDLLGALCNRGWIQRHKNPQCSHFWRLLQGEHAVMFGAFSAYERQLLHDWIAGDWLATRPPANHSSGPDCHAPVPMGPGVGDEFDRDVNALNQKLDELAEPARIARLIELMAPGCNATPAGLAATRLFAGLVRRNRIP